MAHQLSSYFEPILEQLNAEASYLLYVIPVATILAFGLLIYAFGFKKVKLPEDSASADQTKKGKNKGPKAKSKTKGSSPQQSVVKANGTVNTQPQKQQLPAKPKAVVQPIKQEKVVEKTKKNQVKEKKSSKIDSSADLNSGDWVTVTSKKAVKSQEKQLAKKEKKEKLSKETKQSTSSGSTIKVTNLMLDEEPVVTTIESIWAAAEEEQLEFEDTRALKKKQPSKKSKEKVAAKKQAEAEAVVLAEPQRPIPEDKLTKTVIANYDSVSEQKSRKKSDSKKPDVAVVEPKKASKKAEPKAPVEAKPASKSESANRPVAPKTSPAPEVTPKPPSKQVEKPVAAPAPAPSSSTDITDATESDPSEGEFKVVRKRKARRE